MKRKKKEKEFKWKSKVVEPEKLKMQGRICRCQFCKRVWQSRIDNPKCCVYCKRVDWEEK